MSRPLPIPPETEKYAAVVVDSALRVHSALGPGLLESVYEACLAHELSKRGIPIQRQVILPVIYDGIMIESGLRIDLIAGDAVVVEVKTVERLLPVFEAQILTYLKMSGMRLGLLINFNVPLIREGIRRFAL
jgi:GxxExxY protein